MVETTCLENAHHLYLSTHDCDRHTRFHCSASEQSHHLLLVRTTVLTHVTARAYSSRAGNSRWLLLPLTFITIITCYNESSSGNAALDHETVSKD